MIEVGVISVPVSDQQRAKSFYVDRLGFELRRDDTSTGLRWLRVRPPRGSVELSLVTWFESMPPGSLRGLVLHVPDLIAEYQRLYTRGVRFDGPPQHFAWGFEAIMHDPDGNELVLQQC
jgi:predicted enzyme related to lactoylglutathione lyase